MLATTLSLTVFGSILLRIACAAALGALIGLERQWRARAAGIRTNTLVALGAALFAIMGAYAFASGGDPTRVAAQVASGIGFLGAGVIMKQGASISGINTAATLWASAAVGLLAGSGLVLVALAGTALIMGANTLLRPVSRRLDRRLRAKGRESDGMEYTFEVKCARENEVTVRAIVFDAVHHPGFSLRSIAATDAPDDIVLITAILDTPTRDDDKIERSLAAIVPTPEVLGVRWSVEHISMMD